MTNPRRGAASGHDLALLPTDGRVFVARREAPSACPPDASRRPGEPPRDLAEASAAGLGQDVADARTLFVYTDEAWAEAARGLGARPDDDRVVALGPLVALLLPHLEHYRWPGVLGDLGLSDEGGADGDGAAHAARLFALADALANHARHSPDRLRAIWGAVVSAAEAAALGLPSEVATGAALATVAAAALAWQPARTQRQDPPLTPADVPDLARDAFAPGGALSRAHPSFEPREGQRILAEAVAETFEREELLLAEAGTGTGKSLAYLLPAALWAQAGHGPVVVATYTRNLQDQLRTRDVPILRRALDHPLDVLVVKGRSNYPCVRRVVEMLEEASRSLFGENLEAAAFLVSWAAQTDTADLEAISPEAAELVPRLAEAVEEVRAHYWTCASGSMMACPTEKACALRRLRRAAEKADLIITNQAVLMADVEYDVLPTYRYAVLDEAHHLEEAATSALTAEVSSAGLRELGRRLSSTERGRGVPGALVAARQALGDAGGWLAGEQAEWELWLKTWDEAAAALAEAVTRLTGGSKRRRRGQPEEPSAVRLDAETRATKPWLATAERAETLADLAAEGASALGKLAQRVEAESKAEGIDVAGPAALVAGAAASLLELRETVERLLDAQRDTVTWAEAGADRYGTRWSLCVAPVDVARALAASLYSPRKAVVLTGAVLTVDQTFSFYRRACGLDFEAHRVVELQVPSPFDWASHLLLCVPRDLPEPGGAEHAKMVVDVTWRLAEMSGGGLLALFTSRRRMLAAYEALRGPLRDAGLSVLCQDVSGERWWLMEQMRADPRTVVLGVRSLWEGVDVPGDHLRCVVVEKLPFAVPDEPLVAAKMQHLTDQGVDAYAAYYVPEAIRALRQGVGRVLRAATDVGAVFLLDTRIHTRRYGRRFLRSLPPATVCQAGVARCLTEAAAWLAEGGAAGRDQREEPRRARKP